MVWVLLGFGVIFNELREKKLSQILNGETVNNNDVTIFTQFIEQSVNIQLS